MRKTGNFGKEERIKKNRDIQRLFKKGKRISASGAKLFFLSTGHGINRIAFTLPGKYGNAVERNRCKRLSREAYRLLKARMRTGYDMVLLVYPGLNSLQDRYDTIRYLCGKAGLLI